MLEVEIKLPIEDEERVHVSLEKQGFKKAKRILEEDTYFDDESGRIRKNDQAFRVRMIRNLETQESEAVITFKGKKLDQVSKTRKELETGVEDAATARQIFEALGFHAVSPIVTKIRQEYVSDKVTACLDQVEGLGTYLELEIVIPEEESRESALAVLEGMLEQMGYSLKDTIRDSYLGLLQGK